MAVLAVPPPPGVRAQTRDQVKRGQYPAPPEQGPRQEGIDGSRHRGSHRQRPGRREGPGQVRRHLRPLARPGRCAQGRVDAGRPDRGPRSPGQEMKTQETAVMKIRKIMKTSPYMEAGLPNP